MGDYSDYRQRSGGGRSPDGIANKIISTRKYPGNDFLSFLIVEGDTDNKFYASFVDKNRCQIIVAFNKSLVIQVISILERETFPGALAIVDADFDILESNPPSSSNVVLTDTHDLETMIIRSPAFEKVLGEFGSEEKIHQITQKIGKDIRTLLLECGTPLGYLRWVSLRENLSLAFEDLNFSKFISRDSLTIDRHELIQAVKNKSQRPDISEARLKASIQDLQNDAHNAWYVCCGHDLIRILSRGLHGAFSRGKNDTRDASPDILEISLRLAFEHSHFYKTHLYLSVQNWERANAPYVILALE